MQPRIEVFDGVYRPAEDSELLLEALSRSPGEALVIDVGTGTGVAAVYAALQGSEVVAIDISPLAVENAVHNARINGLGNRIHVVQCDLAECIRRGAARLALFNTPYLPVDDRGIEALAWSGGEGGVEIACRFASQASELGIRRLLLVTSSLADYGRLEKCLRGAGYSVKIRRRLHLFFEDIMLVEAVMP